MKKIITLATLILFLALPTFAQETGNLTVTVKDIEDGSFGPVVILVYEGKEGFPKAEEKAAFRGVVKRYILEASYTFEDLPHGDYAIVAYVDENLNGRMDTNLLGVPQEPVGVTNSNRFSRSAFQEAVISFNQTGKAVNLDLLY